LIMQSLIRMQLAQAHYTRSLQNIKHLQSLIRGENTRRTYNQVKNASIYLQSLFRRGLTRRYYTAYKSASIVLQSQIRKHISQSTYSHFKKASTTIQSLIRGNYTRVWFHNLLTSTYYLQGTIKSYLQSKKLTQQRHAAIFLQSLIRMSKSQKRYDHLLKITTTLQSIICRNQVKSWYSHTYHAALVIQANVKRDILVNKFQQLQRASIVLQAYARGTTQKSKFIQFKRDIILVQSVVRRRLVKRNMRDLVLTRLVNAREHLLRVWVLKEESLFRRSMFMIAYSDASLGSLFACQEEARRLEGSTSNLNQVDHKLHAKNILFERELLYSLLKMHRVKMPKRASIGGSGNINQLFLDWGVDPTSKKRKRKLLLKIWNHPELAVVENERNHEIKSPNDANVYWGRCMKSAELVMDLLGVTKKFVDFSQTRGISITTGQEKKRENLTATVTLG